MAEERRWKSSAKWKVDGSIPGSSDLFLWARC